MRFVITAGPTREADRSGSLPEQPIVGQNGIRDRRSGDRSRTRSILISGPVSSPPPDDARSSSRSSRARRCITPSIDICDDCDVLVMCAAVADYKPVKASPQKIKKSAAALVLDLVPTRDILASIAAQERQFSGGRLRRRDGQPRGKRAKKLLEKNCDIDCRQRCEHKRIREWKLTKTKSRFFFATAKRRRFRAHPKKISRANS